MSVGGSLIAQLVPCRFQWICTVGELSP